MGILPSTLDYTDRDFDALRVRLYKGLQTVYPDWSDTEVATFGNLMVEMYCFVGDVHTYYGNRHAREAHWATALLRRSLLNIGKSFGYAPTTASASQVDVTITTVSGDNVIADLVITPGTIVRTSEAETPVRFRLLAAATILAGTSSVESITAEDSELRQEVFASTGLPNQEMVLASTPFLEQDLAVSDSIGAFTLVDSFLDSTGSDRDMTFQVDENEQATLRFGTGITGAIPVGDVTVDYKVGGGSTGRVAATTVNRIDGSFSDALGNPVLLVVTNPAESTPAVDRPSVEQMRVAGPGQLTALTRTVGRPDFEINAERVSGVARVLMLTNNQDPGLPENSGILFVIPEGGGSPTAAMLALVETEIVTVRPHTVTFNPSVQGGVYLAVDIAATVYLRSGYETVDAIAAAKVAILADIDAFFAILGADGTVPVNARTGLPTVDFGYNYQDAFGNPTGSLAWSDVFNVVRDAIPVQRIDPSGFLIAGARDDLTIAMREFPIVGTVTLTNGATGAPL